MPFYDFLQGDPLIDDSRCAPLGEQEQVRTARHLALLDASVQQRFAAARVCVIGAGGLGSPLLLSLVSAGVGAGEGWITICDDDVVDVTNLQRQILFSANDVGKKKTDVAASKLREMNPSVTIRTVGRFDESNAMELCRTHDLVIDGSDNFATRFVAADAAEATGTPLVWGAVLRFDGQLSVFWHPHGPGLRDLFPEPPSKPVLSCAQAGVLGATTAVMGSLMATEALKLLGHFGQPLIGQVLVYDAATATSRIIGLSRDPDRIPASGVSSPADAAATCNSCTDGSLTSIGSGEADSAVCAVDDLTRVLADESTVLFDVREDHERLMLKLAVDGSVTRGGVGQGVSARDVHLPLGQLERIVAECGDDAFRHVGLPENARTVVVYCAAGVRSAQAVEWLSSDGATEAGIKFVSLEGGIEQLRRLSVRESRSFNTKE